MTDEKQIADIIVTAVKVATAQLGERIAVLEHQMTNRQMPTPDQTCDKGAWRPGAAYDKGDRVTHRGLTWVCHGREDAR